MKHISSKLIKFGLGPDGEVSAELTLSVAGQIQLPPQQAPH